VEQPVSDAWQVFVHFTDASGTIRFQNDQQPTPAVTEWKPGEVLQGPFTVTVPEGLSGTFEVRLGLYQPDSGRRALLQGRRNRDRSYLVGKFAVKEKSLEFTPAELGLQPPGGDLFTQGDNGWAAGMHRLDRFIKNTYEILSPLNELTARMQMTKHEFLTSDRQVQRTIFGQGADEVIVTVNLGNSDYTGHASNQQVQLPPLGFLVESPMFVAFHARNWNGLAYDKALPLFTARSLDGQPISQSHKVRIFHGFGDDRIRFGKSPVSVQREQIIDPNS
jgi:hypothetical protein